MSVSEDSISDFALPLAVPECIIRLLEQFTRQEPGAGIVSLFNTQGDELSGFYCRNAVSYQGIGTSERTDGRESTKSKGFRSR
ncbi:MAG: hypothetical protein ABSH56_14245 [Bryobacteraceae bacterium]